MDDDLFVNINKHIDAADERLVHLRGHFHSSFLHFRSIMNFFFSPFRILPARILDKANFLCESAWPS